MPRSSIAFLAAVLTLAGCSQDKATSPKETSTLVRPGYEITLPANYDVYSGPTIDTYDFQARRDDEKVVLEMEVGGGTPIQPERFSELPQVYGYPNRVEFTASGSTGVYFYEVDESLSLRPISGAVIWDAASGNGYEEVFFTSHSKDSLPEVLEVLKTLKHD